VNLIQPGELNQDTYIECFNRRSAMGASRNGARGKIECRKQGYNANRLLFTQSANTGIMRESIEQ